MKIILVSLMLVGCTTLSYVQYKEETYKIEAGGNCFTSTKDTDKEARDQAAVFCPGGYKTHSQSRDGADCHPRTQLIVQCY